MTVLINDVPIDFELENEQTIGDVHDSLVEWLQASGHYLNSIVIDGEEIERAALESETTAWRTQSVDSINEMRLHAVSRRQDEIEALETITNYVDLYRRVLEEGSEDQIRSVLDEYEAVDDGISRLMPDIAGLLIRTDGSDPATRTAAATRAREIHGLVAERQRELLDPQHEMRQVLTAIESVLPHIVELPAQLQTGREREGMSMVARVAALVSRFMRLLPLVAEVQPVVGRLTVGDNALHEAMSELTEQLKELQLALEGQDLVLVADLMEYELQPRLEALVAAVRGSLDSGLHRNDA